MDMSGDPFRDMMESLRDEILDGVESLIEAAVSRGQSREVTELDPFELYTASEAADLLGLDRATMYEIPESELPRCQVGPARGATRWMGADLLAYARGLDPLDYQQMIEELRDEMRQPHAPVQSDGPTRVM